MEKSYNGQYFSICAKRCAQTIADAKEGLASAPPGDLLQTHQGLSKIRKAYLYEKNHINLTPDDCVWGGAQKGVVWLNLFDRECRFCVVDINPYKQGRFVLGTGHRILAPIELKNRPPRNFFVMNEIYMDEVKAMVNQLLPNKKIQFYAVGKLHSK